MKKQLKFITYALFIATCFCTNFKTNCIEKNLQETQTYLKISQIVFDKLPTYIESSLTSAVKTIDDIRTKPVTSLKQGVEIGLIYESLRDRIVPDNCRVSVIRSLIFHFSLFTAYNIVLEMLKSKFSFLDIDNLLKKYNLGDRKPILLGKYLFDNLGENIKREALALKAHALKEKAEEVLEEVELKQKDHC